MSFTEMLEQVGTLTSDERKELLAAIQEAERQDKQTAEQSNGEKPKNFAEAAAHLIGSVDSGLGDLSTNKKYMEGFGRDNKRNY